ncbi:hypothetical protein OPV22_012388 [Ensete ventricosum]|uniref:NIF system FeS cluster assembly NifU C-terminal domain-containing protein n=1 Tax=Ensete ventricosum TaxID=4639 RepID=A0AAV8R308_ENSVE|nr:hypothetical protein OPV22_012388 [Ensete ventricosum]
MLPLCPSKGIGAVSTSAALPLRPHSQLFWKPATNDAMEWYIVVSSASIPLPLRNQWPFSRNPSNAWASSPWIGFGEICGRLAFARQPVTEVGSADFPNAHTAMTSPLVTSMFEIDGISRVFFGSYFVTLIWTRQSMRTIQKLDSGIVKLRMQGACSGCPSSSVTLKSSIENMLMHYVPEVKGVDQELDTDEGAS